MSLENHGAAMEVSFYQTEKHLYPSLRNPCQPLALANEPAHLKKKYRRHRSVRTLATTGLSFL